MDNILSEMINFGLDVCNVVADGQIHRCHSNAKAKRNKDGWWVLKEYHGKHYAAYGCWVRGEQGKCSSDGGTGVNNIEIWKAIEKERQKDHEARDIDSKSRALEFINNSGLSDGSHKYLVTKKINPCGVHQSGDSLIIPIINPEGEIVSYQTIGVTGRKQFMLGGRVGGCCYSIPGTSNTIAICEGFATGASINKATGFKVLVAFNAGNIAKVAKVAVEKFPESDILICADNDYTKDKNVGLETGRKVSLELGIGCVWPTGILGSDFNDMAIELGESEVANAIIKGRVTEIYKIEDKKTKFDFIENPPGILKDIQEYYNLTAIKPQPLFAIATGLILGSVVLGRRYSTGIFNNYTSVYFLLVAKSGTGKDHPKSVVRKLLNRAHLTWMERAGGYTAANTLMKSLERQPLQISFFEEIGMKLGEASKNSRSMATGVFRQMLDIWSSCHSLTVGEEYSDGTVPTVKKPALTFVGITTPRELFRSINESLIEQGFVNRLLPFISKEDRSASKLKILEDIDTSRIEYLESKICDWILEHWPMFSSDLSSLLDPDAEFLKNPDNGDVTDITFSQESIELLNAIEEELILDAGRLEKYRLDDMLSRCREITMRISLIVAGMDNQKKISVDYVGWAYSVVYSLFNTMIEEIKRNVSGSEFEAMKLEALTALRLAGEKGINPQVMPKTSPFSKWTKKERDEILADLMDSELIEKIRVRTGKRGPGSMVWVALQ